MTSTRYSDWQPCKPLHGYRIGQQHASGAIALSGRDDMGTHLVLSGAALAALDRTQSGAIEMIDRIKSAGGTIGRLDLAVDAINSKVKIARVKNSIEQSTAQTGARTWLFVESENKGFTLYIGSRQSERYMRIYNKAAEHFAGQAPDGAQDWLRFEIELKGSTANRIASLLTSERDLDKTVRSSIVGFFDMPGYPSWRRVFEGSIADQGESARKLTDTKKWLLDIAAKSLAREAELNAAFLETFNQAVVDWREQLKNQSW